MKYLILFAFISIATHAQVPCGGASGSYHTNYDSSPGGFVESK